MLVQLRGDSLRLIRQHDHALLAGHLASAWRLPEVGPVPWPTVVATSLHDVVWCREDRKPRLDPTSGRPWDFASLPTPRKTVLVAEGVARLRTLSPELGRAVEAHHRALARGVPEGSDPELTRIRFFDLLSLRICLTPPPAREPPAWLSDPGPVAPDGYVLPGLRWTGPAGITLSPFPFGEPLEIAIPVRDLPPGPYRDQAELDRAWQRAGERRWMVAISPPKESAE